IAMLVRWPDYRASNAELRELVLRYVEPNPVFAVPEGSNVKSIPEGSFSGVPGLHTGEHPAASSASGLDAIQAAHTEPTGSELTAESNITAAPSKPKRSVPVWPFALGGVTLAAGIAGILWLGSAHKAA